MQAEGLFSPAQGGIKLDVKLPEGALALFEEKLRAVWWAGFATGFAWGALAVIALGLVVLLLRNQAMRDLAGRMLLGVAALAGMLLLLRTPEHTPARTPATSSQTRPVKPTMPDCPDCPEPAKPKPRRPWGLFDPFAVAEEGAGKITLGGDVGPAGQEVQIHLPLAQRMRNIGSKVDGAGMCVSTSMTHAVRWHNLREWRDFRDWCAQYPGGGYPSKMDAQIKQFAQARATPIPPYLQYQGKDLGVLRQMLKAGLLPSITYSGRDGVRYSGSISHMVNLVYLDETSAAILDNNGKPEDLIWMSVDEFAVRFAGGRSGWAHVWIVPGPPPVPRN